MVCKYYVCFVHSVDLFLVKESARVTHWRLFFWCVLKQLLRLDERREQDKSDTWNITGTALTDSALRWRHNGHDSVSNHQPRDCLLNRLFRRRSKKTPKLRVTGLCAGNSPVTGEFPAQMVSNAENDSIWWRHHQLTANSKTDSAFMACIFNYIHGKRWNDKHQDRRTNLSDGVWVWNSHACSEFDGAS